MHWSKTENRKIVLRKLRDGALRAHINDPLLRERISQRTREAMSDPEIRRKISLANKRRPSPMLGKKRSAEFCLKSSLGHKGQKPWNTGKHWALKHRRIMSIAHGGNGVPQRKYPLEFDYNLKKQVFYRDGHKCRMCGSNRRLVCHHKDENKKNNTLSNLQTVCKACHIKIHGIAGWNKKKRI